ncbi:tetratricopeptide repeat protein [Candidatus Riflebacteria bacterium]
MSNRLINIIFCATLFGFFNLTGIVADEEEEERARHKAMQQRERKFIAFRTTAEAYKNLATLYQKQKKTDKAIVHLKKIIELFENYKGEKPPEVSKQIGHVYLEIGKMLIHSKQLSEAEKNLKTGFEKTRKVSPEIASRMLFMLGNIYQKQKKLQDAEKTFQKVIELNAEILTGKK